jgi:hypothetical protein
MPTLAERYAEALTALGLTEVTANQRSRRYRCFTSSHPALFYYIGKAGSLRIGRCRTESRPVSDRVKRDLLARTRPVADLFAELLTVGEAV